MSSLQREYDESTGAVTFRTTNETGETQSWSFIPDFQNTTIKLQMTDPDGNVYSATIDVSKQ